MSDDSKFTIRQLFEKAQGRNGQLPGAGAQSEESFDKRDARQYERLINRSQRKGDIFMVAVVEEVISEPHSFFNKSWPEERTYDGKQITIGDVHSGRVTVDDDDESLPPSPYYNKEMVDFAPANSIRAFLKLNTRTNTAAPSIICFPFFSSHFSLPVKPGEHVWVIQFDESTYYWFCRKSSFRQIEDVNYTFSGRQDNIKNNNLFGAGVAEDENTFYHFDSSDEGTSINYQKIIEDSISYKEEFTGEIVPKLSKDCGDFMIQGSNNSHIYLGKPKFVKTFEELESVSSDYFASPEIMTDATSVNDVIEERRPLSPTIDLCILRGAREVYALKDAIDEKTSNSQILNLDTSQVRGAGLDNQSYTIGAVLGEKDNSRFSYYETDKARDRREEEVSGVEFKDNEIYNCAARIYMTNGEPIDKLLGLTSCPTPPGMAEDVINRALHPMNNSSAVIMSKQTRILGETSAWIVNRIGGSGMYFSPSGDVIIYAGRHEDGSAGGQIVLEAGTGDIRIVPGTNGVLKLGSNNPIGGIASTVDSLRTGGNVEAPPIMTTAGGFVGVPDNTPTGTFSNKVLIAVPSTTETDTEEEDVDYLQAAIDFINDLI